MLSLGFLILLIKVSICVMPGVFGVIYLIYPEDKKRKLRNILCITVFGVNNAISYRNFQRCLYVVCPLLIFFSLISSWFLLLRKFFILE